MYRTLGVVVLILALVAAVLLMAGCPKPKTDVTPMSGMMPKGGPGPGMTPPPPMTPPPAVGETKKGEAPVPGETKEAPKGDMKTAPAAKGPGAMKMPPPPPPAPPK